MGLPFTEDCTCIATVQKTSTTQNQYIHYILYILYIYITLGLQHMTRVMHAATNCNNSWVNLSMEITWG